MPGSWSDYLELRSGDAPPASVEDGDVRVYADSNGALRSVQSDGTDAPIGGDSSVLSLSTTTLTDAQVLALPTTAVELVAAPGANEIVMPIQAMLSLKWAGDYGNIDSTCLLGVKWDHAFAPLALQLIGVYEGNALFGVTTLLQGVESKVASLGVNAGLHPSPNETAVSSEQVTTLDFAKGLALVLKAANGSAGDFTGGDPANELVVSVLYYTVTLP